MGRPASVQGLGLRDWGPGVLYRFLAKREHLLRIKGLLPESQGHNMALTVLHVPYSLGCGPPHLNLWSAMQRSRPRKQCNSGKTRQLRTDTINFYRHFNIFAANVPARRSNPSPLAAFERDGYRLIDFVNHSTLGLSVIKKKKDFKELYLNPGPGSGFGRLKCSELFFFITLKPRVE